MGKKSYQYFEEDKNLIDLDDPKKDSEGEGEQVIWGVTFVSARLSYCVNEAARSRLDHDEIVLVQQWLSYAERVVGRRPISLLDFFWLRDALNSDNPYVPIKNKMVEVTPRQKDELLIFFVRVLELVSKDNLEKAR